MDISAMGLEGLLSTQYDDGSWQGDYSGPMFLLPTYVITMFAAEQTIDLARCEAIVNYLESAINIDGGVGLYIEGPSRLYPSVLTYVALRLAGVPASAHTTQRLLRWITANGGPLQMAPWGKLTLALIGLHEYEGVLPMPPELWLLPRSVPFQPLNMWCHSRMIFLPMAYLYGVRFCRRIDQTIVSLRNELYGDYQATDFEANMLTIAPCDALFMPADGLAAFLRIAGQVNHKLLARSPLRKRAIRTVLQHINYEDINTNYICIGPVNKLFNMLVWHHAKAGGAEFEAHLQTVDTYLHDQGETIKFNGYNSTALWDTSFAVQAIAASGDPLTTNQLSQLRQARQFILDQQIVDEAPWAIASGRAPSVGGWPFSDKRHGWPITDCTAEAIKGLIALDRAGVEALDTETVDAIRGGAEWILGLQNADGSWASYERTRGPRWIEKLNPAALWGNIMIDYGYVECTSACIQASAQVCEIEGIAAGTKSKCQRAISRGTRWIRNQQREDGSWYGSWGVCFTYGTWFGIKGLMAAGCNDDDPAIRRAVEFIYRHQASDGGWGEDPRSSLDQRYIATDRSQSVMTAWALLALSAAGEAETDGVKRGVRCLAAMQESDGGFRQDVIAGMFNQSTAIHYDNYRTIFPTWALGVTRQYVEELPRPADRVA